MITLQEFINRHNVIMFCSRTDSNPNMLWDEKWNATAHHYRCVLRCGKRTLTTPFSQGSAHTKEPTLAEVLGCLASDAAGFANAQSFEDWCSEYGYDTDSRKAERTFKIVKREAAKLRKLLGSDAAYETLLWDTEQL